MGRKLQRVRGSSVSRAPPVTTGYPQPSSELRGSTPAVGNLLRYAAVACRRLEIGDALAWHRQRLRAPKACSPQGARPWRASHRSGAKGPLWPFEGNGLPGAGAGRRRGFQTASAREERSGWQRSDACRLARSCRRRRRSAGAVAGGRHGWGQQRSDIGLDRKSGAAVCDAPAGLGRQTEHSPESRELNARSPFGRALRAKGRAAHLSGCHTRRWFQLRWKAALPLLPSVE